MDIVLIVLQSSPKTPLRHEFCHQTGRIYADSNQPEGQNISNVTWKRGDEASDFYNITDSKQLPQVCCFFQNISSLSSKLFNCHMAVVPYPRKNLAQSTLV